MFFKGSRYEDVSTESITMNNGQTVAYKRIRMILTPDAIGVHRVQSGERLDNIAFRHYGDPERYWRICDANLALCPFDLVNPFDDDSSAVLVHTQTDLLIPNSEE